MIALRRANPALQQGETEWVVNGDPNRILTFYRRGAEAEFFIAINCSNRPFFGAVEVSGRFEDVTPRLEEQKAPTTALPVLSLGRCFHPSRNALYSDTTNSNSSRHA